MSKENPKKSKVPLLTGALICERVLLEEDKVPSIIRVIDKIFLNKNDIKKNKDGVAFDLTIFVSLKSGDFEGDCELSVDHCSPSGRRKKGKKNKVTMLGKDNGVNVFFKPLKDVTEEGLHWFLILVNGIVLTKIPLVIEYEKMSGNLEPAK